MGEKVMLGYALLTIGAGVLAGSGVSEHAGRRAAAWLICLGAVVLIWVWLRTGMPLAEVVCGR